MATERRWIREDALNISLAAGEASSAVHSIVSPINDKLTPAELLAVLMMSAHIDGWNWRRALVDAEGVARDVLSRMAE